MTLISGSCFLLQQKVAKKTTTTRIKETISVFKHILKQLVKVLEISHVAGVAMTRYGLHAPGIESQ
jgi:hypothetical protein